MKVLVIIPAYNEEKSIGSVIQEIKLHVPNCDILVINDGSKDRTVEVAEKNGAKVVTMPFNVGIGGGMQTGYLYAASKGYDFAVQIDADGQHRPEELPKLLKAAQDTDLVIGSRYVEKTQYRSSKMRRIGMVFFSALVSLITKQRFTDTTSGYRVASRKVIQMFSEYYPTDYPEVEAIVFLKYKGCKLTEVPTEMRERQGGFSSITPIRSIYYMLKVTFSLFINVLRYARG